MVCLGPARGGTGRGRASHARICRSVLLRRFRRNQPGLRSRSHSESHGISSFLDPGALSALSNVPESFYKIVGRFTQRYQASRAKEVGDAVISPAQRDLFDEMASRRVANSVAGVMQIIGATFRATDPVTLVAFRNSNREIVSATDQFITEPDLISHFKLHHDARTDTRFVLRIPLLRTLRPTGDLVFFTKNGAEFSGPASAILAGKPPTADGRSDGEVLLCWIRSQKIITPSHATAFAVQGFVGKYHGLFVIVISWIGLAALFVLLFCARRVHWSDPIYAALAMLAITIVLRVALFSFLDATSWPADAPRYSFPVMPLYNAFVLALIYQAWRVASEVLKARTASLNRAIPASDKSN